jgi:hypothetical protein
MSQIDFNSTRGALDKLASISNVSGRPFVSEALNRVDQLQWLCVQIELIENEMAKIDWRVWESTDPDRFHPRMIELQTLTETFYYIAWRLIALLDRDDAPIPSLRGLRSKCVGIRTVRNKLLEHPEASDSRVHIPSIMFGTAEGPRLKLVAETKTDKDGKLLFRTNKADLFDRGLWVNARELKEAIESKLGST